MKYYDGFGKDVTDYVVNLEQRVKYLESMTLPLTPSENKPILETVENVKPKRKRSKKKLDANPQ